MSLADHYYMHPMTAASMLQLIAQKEQLTVRDTTFHFNVAPQLFHQRDVKVAFVVLADALGHKPPSWRYALGSGLDFWCRGPLFEKLFKIIFMQQKLYPKNPPTSLPEGGPLPVLFVNAEKTQVRQIPLADERPWPFKFLLELGGMIVCKTENKRDLLMELRQYLLNFPQFRIKVHAEEWPTGETLIVTTWFQQLKLMEKK